MTKEYEKKKLDKRIRKSKNQKNTEYEKIQSRRGVFSILYSFDIYVKLGKSKNSQWVIRDIILKKGIKNNTLGIQGLIPK